MQGSFSTSHSTQFITVVDIGACFHTLPVVHITHTPSLNTTSSTPNTSHRILLLLLQK